MTRHFDVVVLGGGPAGSTAACQLARSSGSVLIVEAKAASAFKIGETVPGIANLHFYRSGFENLLASVPQLRCSGNRSAWGDDELQFRSSMLDPYGGGSHIDRRAFDEALLAEAVSAGAQFLRGARPHDWSRRRGGWHIALPSPIGEITCDAVVDCTGRQAAFARSQGARRIALDRQIAVVAQLSAPTDPDLSTTIESAQIGWWYSAQVPSRKRIVALFSDADLLADSYAKTVGGLTSLLAATKHISAFACGGGAFEGPLATVLADTAYLTASADDGWCAAGDAAASSDPLASMGIMNAVRAGSDAARLVMSGFSGHRAYSEAVVEAAMSHVQQRRAYCLMESRWPNSPFWARRREPLARSRVSER